MGELANFARKNSKFLQIADGESFQGRYLGYKISQNTFDPEKEIIIYEFQDVDGRKVYWKSTSTFVAKVFDGMMKSSLFKLTRQGEGTTTRWVFDTPEIVM